MAGILTERVARGLADAPPAAKIVATVGLLLAVSGHGDRHLRGGRPSPSRRSCPTRTFEFAGLNVGVDQLISSVIAAAPRRSGCTRSSASPSPVSPCGASSTTPTCSTSPAPARPGCAPRRGSSGTASPPCPASCWRPQTGLDSILLTLLVVQAFGAAAVGRLHQPPADLRRRARHRCRRRAGHQVRRRRAEPRRVPAVAAVHRAVPRPPGHAQGPVRGGGPAGASLQDRALHPAPAGVGRPGRHCWSPWSSLPRWSAPACRCTPTP